MTNRTNGQQALADEGLLLSVDTSTASMTVSLSRGPVLLAEYTSRAERNHSLYLLPAMEEVMREAGVRPRDLSAFAAGVGPGSYTGTRIGVTVAKTYAWTHGLTLLGVSTLEAIALGGGEAAYARGAGAFEQGAAAADRGSDAGDLAGARGAEAGQAERTAMEALRGGSGAAAHGQEARAESCVEAGLAGASQAELTAMEVLRGGSGAASQGQEARAESRVEAVLAGASQAELTAMEALLDRSGAGRRLWLVPLIDARRGQAFTALYEAGREWTCLVPDGIRLMQQWTGELLQRLRQQEQAGDGGETPLVLFTGEVELHEAAIEAFAALWNGPVAYAPHALRARSVAELGRSRWLRGERDEPHGLVPNYTQLAEAEAKLLAKKS